MRIILFLFISFLSISAHADDSVEAPQAVVGVFEYAERYWIDDVRRIEVVPREDPDMVKRVRSLRNDGHTCVEAARGFNCVKVLQPLDDNGWIDDKVFQAMEGWLLRLNRPVGDMKPVFRTDFQKMWTIEQKSYLPGRATYHADYVWTQGAWTLHPWNDNEPKDFQILLTERGLEVPHMFEREDGAGVERAFVRARLRTVE